MDRRLALYWIKCGRVRRADYSSKTGSSRAPEMRARGGQIPVSWLGRGAKGALAARADQERRPAPSCPRASPGMTGAGRAATLCPSTKVASTVLTGKLKCSPHRECHEIARGPILPQRQEKPAGGGRGGLFNPPPS